ncbi:MAG TPA: alpha/beta fold hydrolase [Actinomycetota bacterium]|nr:alpha/beta fold hydrolase [Actinomycetota bacterium]
MEPVSFTCEDGVRLEGELRMPDGEPRGSAVICHAHPRFGGSKDHPLLWAIRNDLAVERDLAVLGFNFRGIMGSSGTYGGGRDELKDARAAVTEVRTHVADDRPTLLVGWSFGASVALREAIDDRRVDALALVGMPTSPKDLSLPPLPEAADLRLLKRPALLLAGENDEHAAPDDLRAYADAFPDAEVVVVPGTDHYFWRREKEAAGVIGAFADRRLRSTA